MRHLHGGRGDVPHIELRRQRVDDRAEIVQPATGETLAQRLARRVEAPHAKIGRGRKLDDLDPLPRERFDVPHQVLLARIDQRDRHTLAADAAGPADAMHVAFG